jgi:hypothetical protein
VTCKDPKTFFKGKEESQEATSAAQAERVKLKDGLATARFFRSESCIAGVVVVQQHKVVRRFFLWERRAKSFRSFPSMFLPEGST